MGQCAHYKIAMRQCANFGKNMSPCADHGIAMGFMVIMSDADARKIYERTRVKSVLL